MNTLIVADESVDYAIIQLLRSTGFSVLSIVEEHPGWSDSEVLELAFQLNAYLITEDKDFGELTYRLRRPSHGIMLVRMMEESNDEKADLVVEVLSRNMDRLISTFAVLAKHKLRIRPL